MRRRSSCLSRTELRGREKNRMAESDAGFECRLDKDGDPQIVVSRTLLTDKSRAEFLQAKFREVLETYPDQPAKIRLVP